MASVQNKAEKLIREVLERYRKYVSENPETVSQIEATSRVLSYIIAGLFSWYLEIFYFHFDLFDNFLHSLCLLNSNCLMSHFLSLCFQLHKVTDSYDT